MSDFPHDAIKPFSNEGPKKAQVSEMFDRIAPRYDFYEQFSECRYRQDLAPESHRPFQER
jgi:ubiquinone/menaquinone biosynthesis C-methylase UbiE